MTCQHPRPAIALVVPAFALGGGVPTVATFLHRVITESGRYTPEIISLALSARDANSLRLLSPASWTRGIQITISTAQGLSYRHVGALFAEFEFQRYQPRQALTNLLNQHALVQVVAGTPVWATATRQAHAPVLLFTATTTVHERRSILQHTTGWRRFWLTAMTRLTVRLEQSALSHASCVFAESDYTRRNLTSIVDSRRLCLGVPGIDTTLFRPSIYQPHGYILSVGRFTDPRKNIRLLFTAYAHLRKRVSHPPRLVLVGQAPAQPDWNHALSLGIADCIDIHQNVSQSHLADLYRAASLFVLSSDEEGLGLVILEAMSSGLPVVSTRCGGPETAIIHGETGMLTPVSDAAALADTIQSLLDDPILRQRMGQSGRQVAEERFSLAAAGRPFLERYDALLDGAR